MLGLGRTQAAQPRSHSGCSAWVVLETKSRQVSLDNPKICQNPVIS